MTSCRDTGKESPLSLSLPPRGGERKKGGCKPTAGLDGYTGNKKFCRSFGLAEWVINF